MNIQFEIEVYEEDGRKFVYLSHNGSSGCRYEFHGAEDLKQIVGNYAALAYLDEKDAEEECEE